MKVINTYIVCHHCSDDRNSRAILFETDEDLWYCQYWDASQNRMVMEIQERDLAFKMIAER